VSNSLLSTTQVLAGVSCSAYYDKVRLGDANTFFFYPETKRQYWRSKGARGYEGAHQFCNETYGGSLFLGGMLEGTNITTEGVASRSEQIMAGVAAGLVLDVDRMPVSVLSTTIRRRMRKSKDAS
jgi:hypothetical protein